MKQVFLSYSSHDYEKAKEILNRLESAGITCWMSQRDIPPGSDYAVEIPKAIINCGYFVILMSNTAQDSPYVMLELDQAIKQNKNIIPILLERVVQNEKTNFFLNAKQSVDATTDFTTAVNTVIRKIRPDNPEIPILSDATPKGSLRKNRDLVRCPHCGCTVLKRVVTLEDKYLYPEECINLYEKFKIQVIKNIRFLVEFLPGFSGTVLLFISFIVALDSVRDKKILDLNVEILPVPTILGIIMLCIVWLIEKIPDISTKLIDTIENSGLKYWTFKCAGCEDKFSILLPKEDELKDWVPDLLENDSKE